MTLQELQNLLNRIATTQSAQEGRIKALEETKAQLEKQISDIRLLIREEIIKASKDPKILWKHLDITYFTTTPNNSIGSQSNILFVQDDGSPTLTFNVGDGA